MSPEAAGGATADDAGCGRAWAKEDHQGLARYVYAQEASRCLRLPSSPIDVLDAPGGRLALVAQLYNELAGAGIRYAHELWNPDDRCQTIRPPIEVVREPGHGTCLDLSLLFSGLCLSIDLLPVIVVTQRHALVLVSLDVGPDDYNARSRPKRTLFTGGPMTDPAALAELIDEGRYVAVETTGFAAVSSLPEASLEGAGRVDGLLTFEQATDAGRKRFDADDDPLRFALDIAATHGRGIGPRRIFADTEALVDEVLLKAAEHGLRADRTTGSPELHPLPLPKAPPPRRSRGVIGRDREKSALASVAPGELVGVYGELGAGKTELMRWLAYEPADDLGDGTVYLRCQNTGPLDLLQEVFEFFYDPRSGVQLTPSSAGRYLGDKRARVLLDDFDLSVADTEKLQDALAESGLVIAATGPDALAIGALVEMGPLAPDEAVEIFEREAGALGDGDRSDLLQAFERTGALPRAVVVFARAVRSGSLGVADVLTALAVVPDRAASSSARQRRLAEIIRVADPAYVPRVRLQEMVDATDDELDADLAQLIADELIRPGSPRYRWAGPRGGAIEASAAAELVEATRDWLESGPVPDEVVEDRALVLKAIELAERESWWRDVSHLTRMSEGALALGNRWDAWGRVLSSMARAAEQLGDGRAVAWTDHQLGTRALALGDHATARARLSSAIKRREQLGDGAAAELSRHNLSLLPPPAGPDSGDSDADDTEVRPDSGARRDWIRRHPFLTASVGLLVAICIGLITWGVVDSLRSDSNPISVEPPPDPTTPPEPTALPEPTAPPEPGCGDGEVEGPDGQCEPELTFSCRISTTRPIEPREPIMMFATFDPADIPIEITFDHGDGTREPARDDNTQDAFYVEPGEYTISAQWTTGAQSGFVECGTVLVDVVPTVVTPPACIRFDTLNVGQLLKVGEVFVDGSAEVMIGEFYINGDPFDQGIAEVVAEGYAGGSGNELFLSNVNLLLFLPEAEGWTVRFGEFGGSVNLSVNEDNLGNEAETLAEWSGDSFGGANILVEGNLLIIEGPGVQLLAIGGQEFAIDEICPFGALG